MVTAPTPSTDSSARLTCLSAISVRARRLVLFPETTRLMIGSASGSCFWMTGGSTSGGTLRIAPATFSRTVFAASSRSRPSRNCTVMLALPPAFTLARSWSMPAMPLSAFSIGMITAEVISSGDAPGQPERHVNGRGIGLGEQIDAEIAEREEAQHHERHHQHRGEDGPSDADFRQHGYSVSPLTVTFMPSARLSTSVSATRSPSFTPPRISMRSPTRSPVFSSWTVRRSPSTVNTR